MPIPLPGAAAPTFAELTAQARTVIPAVDPGWTDLNPSDPGVALTELFAWLTEMMMFQAGLVPERNVRAFLALLEGPDGASAALPLERAVPQVVRRLRDRYRAATEEDVRHLLLTEWPHTAEAAADGLGGGRVARVLCLPGRDLTAADPTAEAPAHLSVVVVPAGPDDAGQPFEALLGALSDFLLPRRLLTTRHHVVGPGYVDVRVRADVALRPDAVPSTTLAAAAAALAALLDPLTGGPDGTGWPFGRSVFASELYAALEGVAGVDYGENLAVTAAPPGPADLARLVEVTFTGYDPAGRTYPYSLPPAGAAS